MEQSTANRDNSRPTGPCEINIICFLGLDFRYLPFSSSKYG